MHTLSLFPYCNLFIKSWSLLTLILSHITQDEWYCFKLTRSWAYNTKTQYKTLLPLKSGAACQSSLVLRKGLFLKGYKLLSHYRLDQLFSIKVVLLQNFVVVSSVCIHEFIHCTIRCKLCMNSEDSAQLHINLIQVQFIY